MRRRARRRICRHRLRNGPVRFCATRRAGCAAASAGAICKRFLYKRQAIYVRSARQFPGWWGQGILRGRRESKGRKLVNRFVAGAIGGFFVRAGFSIGRLFRGGSGASGSAASNATENSGPASSSGSAPAYQEPEPEPAPAPAPSTISVYISIDSSRAQSYGLGGFSYGSTVYDALCATGASVSGSSYYVSAINGLAEKQCGDGSGWTYAVNGSFPGKACGRYALSGGESISWIYSTEKNPTMAM